MVHIHAMAYLCHQVNKAYCEAMGDFSQVDWLDAPTNIAQSAIDGVKFRLQNPDATPETIHNNWMEFKIADGWVYGEVKDAEKKTHPSLRPYAELPAAERAKDYIFNAIVRTFSSLPSDNSKEVMNMNFNPGGNPNVTALKFFAALLHTAIFEVKMDGENRLNDPEDLTKGHQGYKPGVHELYQRAMQDLEIVQMLTVKATTR